MVSKMDNLFTANAGDKSGMDLDSGSDDGRGGQA